MRLSGLVSRDTESLIGEILAPDVLPLVPHYSSRGREGAQEEVRRSAGWEAFGLFPREGRKGGSPTLLLFFFTLGDSKWR